MNTIETAIKKLLDNDLPENEKAEILRFLHTLKGEQYLRKQMKEDWENMDNTSINTWIDHPVNSKKLKNKILNQAYSHVKWIKTLKVAAVILPLMICLSSLYFISMRTGLLYPTEYANIVVPEGSTREVILQDGSCVTLNSGSILNYPKRFGLFSREVKLSGEAYFNVEKDSKRPFKVQLKNSHILVTGTKFNVKAYPQDSLFTVLLEQGGINFNSNKQSYTMQQGDYLGYDLNKEECNVTNIKDENQRKMIMNWKNETMVFTNATLKYILDTLKRKFNVSFNVKDSSLLLQEFTLTVDSDDLSEVLKMMEIVSNIKFLQAESNKYEIVLQH